MAGVDADVYYGEDGGVDGADVTMGVEGEETLGFDHAAHGLFPSRAKARREPEEMLERDVARRRSEELQRRLRIFDAKRRTIGLDVQTLDAQCAERAAGRQAAKRTQRLEDKATLRHIAQQKLVEIEKQAMKRGQEEYCKDYSLTNLHFGTKREFDLNDPNARKKEQPARVGDDDPKIGVSSLQQFAGEDLMKEERIRQSRAAQRSFIEQQKFEKAMLKVQNEGEDSEFAAQVDEIMAWRDEMESSEAQLRKDMQRTIMEVNQKRAANVQQKKENQQAGEMRRNDRELNHHASCPFLNENGQTRLENGRVHRTNFKGSSRDDRVEVQQFQRSQSTGKLEKARSEAEQLRFFAHQSENTRRVLVGMDRDKQRTKREIMAQIAKENLKMRDDKDAKKRQESITGSIDESFFTQFGTHTR